jgi:hypothetical protein
MRNLAKQHALSLLMSTEVARGAPIYARIEQGAAIYARIVGLSRVLHETSKITALRDKKKLRLNRAAGNESPEVADRASMLLQTRRGVFDLFCAGRWGLEARGGSEEGHFQLGQNIQRPSTSPCLIPSWTRTTRSVLFVARS